MESTLLNFDSSQIENKDSTGERLNSNNEESNDINSKPSTEQLNNANYTENNNHLESIVNYSKSNSNSEYFHTPFKLSFIFSQHEIDQRYCVGNKYKKSENWYIIKGRSIEEDARCTYCYKNNIIPKNVCNLYHKLVEANCDSINDESLTTLNYEGFKIKLQVNDSCCISPLYLHSSSRQKTKFGVGIFQLPTITPVLITIARINSNPNNYFVIEKVVNDKEMSISDEYFTEEAHIPLSSLIKDEVFIATSDTKKYVFTLLLNCLKTDKDNKLSLIKNVKITLQLICNQSEEEREKDNKLYQAYTYNIIFNSLLKVRELKDRVVEYVKCLEELANTYQNCLNVAKDKLNKLDVKEELLNSLPLIKDEDLPNIIPQSKFLI